MMRWTVTAALLLCAACGNLPVTGDGVVALELTVPSPLTLEEGQTRQLFARALNQDGEEVAAEIRWLTPDETVLVDELTGIVTAVAPSGIGRVQAALGTLRSDLITFTLLPAPTPEPGPGP
jgi:hypothetical protein